MSNTFVDELNNLRVKVADAQNALNESERARNTLGGELATANGHAAKAEQALEEANRELDQRARKISEQAVIVARVDVLEDENRALKDTLKKAEKRAVTARTDFEKERAAHTATKKTLSDTAEQLRQAEEVADQAASLVAAFKQQASAQQTIQKLSK